MLDIKFIKNNPDLVKKACEKRQVKVDIDKVLDIDKRKKEVQIALEDMLAQKNKASKIISQTKNPKEKQKIILKMRELDNNNDRLSENLKKLNKEFNNLIIQIPNMPLGDVPFGKDEKNNVVLREVGEKFNFSFKIKNHLEIGENLDIIDIKRAVKISGTRFSCLKKEAVLIELAIINFVFDILTKEGFVPIIPPTLVKPEAMKGMGHIDTDKDLEERYFLEKDNLFLVGTSEQSVGPLYQGEVFDEKELPKRFVAFSTCFREEAGSYGKDNQGILRVHQFDKIEMFSFCHPMKSQEEHQFLLSLSEKLVKSLKIPYRVVQLCSGDLSRPSASTYDIESWLPGQDKYKETHSISNCTDFQSRRLNIRYRNNKGELSFVHTLNGTAFAIGRILTAIIENYQEKDGSVRVPEVLQKYIIGGIKNLNSK